MSENGASVVVGDPRVSRAITWVWGVIGTALVGGILLAANNLYQLNLTVSRMLDTNTATATQIQDHEHRIRTLENERRGN